MTVLQNRNYADTVGALDPQGSIGLQTPWHVSRKPSFAKFRGIARRDSDLYDPAKVWRSVGLN
jgi:hypothetical protein